MCILVQMLSQTFEMSRLSVSPKSDLGEVERVSSSLCGGLQCCSFGFVMESDVSVEKQTAALTANKEKEQR